MDREEPDKQKQPFGRYFLAGSATFFVAPIFLLIPDNLIFYPLAMFVMGPFLAFVVVISGSALVTLDKFGLRNWLLTVTVGALLGGSVTLLFPGIGVPELSPTAWESTLRFVIAGAVSGLTFDLIAPRRIRRR